MRGHSAPSWPLPLCLAPAGTPARTAAVGSGQLEQAECDLHTGAALAPIQKVVLSNHVKVQDMFITASGHGSMTATMGFKSIPSLTGTQRHS